MTDRTPLTAVPGLARTSSLPPPPPRRSRPEASESRTTPSTDAHTEAPVAARIQRQPSKPERQPRRAEDRAANVTVPVTLSLPVTLVQRLKKYAKANEASYASIVMDAIVSSRDELALLVSRLRPDEESDGIFVRTTPRKAEDRTAISFRTRKANVTAIDNLAASDEISAENRSQLCHAALDAFLP